jgi:hypothetical protein
MEEKKEKNILHANPELGYFLTECRDFTREAFLYLIYNG